MEAVEPPELKITLNLVPRIPVRTQLKSAAMELLARADKLRADVYGDKVMLSIAEEDIANLRGIE